MGAEQINPIRQTETATIAISTALAAAVDLFGGVLIGIQMPASWTAGSITFQASADGTTYRNLYKDDGNEMVIQAAAARYIAIDPTYLRSVRYMKVRSGTSGTPVIQVAERLLTLVLVPE